MAKLLGSALARLAGIGRGGVAPQQVAQLGAGVVYAVPRDATIGVEQTRHEVLRLSRRVAPDLENLDGQGIGFHFLGGALAAVAEDVVADFMRQRGARRSDLALRA